MVIASALAVLLGLAAAATSEGLPTEAAVAWPTEGAPTRRAAVGRQHPPRRMERGDLAEALLDGTADQASNVRLFNSLFTFPKKHRAVGEAAAPAGASERQEKLRMARLSRGPGPKVLSTEEFKGAHRWTGVYVDPDQGFKTTRKMKGKLSSRGFGVRSTRKSGRVWYFKAPSTTQDGLSLTGDLSSLYENSISFTLEQTPLGTNHPIESEGDSQSDYVTDGDVILRGGPEHFKHTLVYYFDRYAPGKENYPGVGTQSEFRVPLRPVNNVDAAGAWVERSEVFDKDASEKVMQSVLRNLDLILIRGRYQTGSQTTYLSKVVFQGCPMRCHHKGTLSRGNCECVCRRGFTGDHCDQEVEFDMESVTKAGKKSGKCITICRPTTVQTSSGVRNRVDCSPEKNIEYVPTAAPVVMITDCRGASNQLFFAGVESLGKRSWYQSVALKGKCLGVGNRGVDGTMKLLGWDKTQRDPALTVVDCDNADVNSMWSTEVAAQDTSRLVLSGGQDDQCVSPHQPWHKPCVQEDLRCKAGPTANTASDSRQAIVGDCLPDEAGNQFVIQRSKYLFKFGRPGR